MYVFKYEYVYAYQSFMQTVLRLDPKNLSTINDLNIFIATQRTHAELNTHLTYGKEQLNEPFTLYQ